MSEDCTDSRFCVTTGHHLSFYLKVVALVAIVPRLCYTPDMSRLFTKSCVLRCRVMPDAFKRMQAAAEIARLPDSEWLRRAVDDAAVATMERHELAKQATKQPLRKKAR